MQLLVDVVEGLQLPLELDVDCISYLFGFVEHSEGVFDCHFGLCLGLVDAFGVLLLGLWLIPFSGLVDVLLFPALIAYELEFLFHFVESALELIVLLLELLCCRIIFLLLVGVNGVF